VAAFLLVTVIFGTSFPAIKFGIERVPPLVLAAARYTTSGVLLLVFSAATGRNWLPRTRADRRAIAAGGVLFIGGTGLTFVGQQYTTSGVAAIIVSLTPVLTVLLAWGLVPAERPTWRGLVGVALGFVGVALVVRPTPAGLLDGAVFGKSLILAATVVVTLGTVLVRRIEHPMSVLPFTGWCMLAGAGVQVAGAATVGGPFAVTDTGLATIAVVAYLGVIAGAIAFGLYFWLLDRIGVFETNLVTYLSPPVSLVTGWALLGEAIQPLALAGFVVIAAGFLVLKNREVAAEIARYRGPGR
jgi:drug/metabolite transporter (DMT)-like permease